MPKRTIAKDLSASLQRLTGKALPTNYTACYCADLGLGPEGIAQVMREVGHRWGYSILYKPEMAEMTVAQLIAYVEPFALRSIDERVRECLAPDNADEISGLDVLGDDLLLDDYNCLFLVEKLEEEFELTFPDGTAAKMPDMTVDEVSEQVANCL